MQWSSLGLTFSDSNVLRMVRPVSPIAGNPAASVSSGFPASSMCLSPRLRDLTVSVFQSGCSDPDVRCFGQAYVCQLALRFLFISLVRLPFSFFFCAPWDKPVFPIPFYILCLLIDHTFLSSYFKFFRFIISLLTRHTARLRVTFRRSAHGTSASRGRASAHPFPLLHCRCMRSTCTCHGTLSGRPAIF